MTSAQLPLSGIGTDCRWITTARGTSAAPAELEDLETIGLGYRMVKTPIELAL